MANLVELREHGTLVEVRLNRADKRNALAFSMLRELVAAGKSIAKRRDVRTVVLTGDGPTFCAGIDLGDLRNPRNKALAAFELLRPGANLFQQAFLTFRDLPVPVIAAIQGHCFGAGMQLALAVKPGLQRLRLVGRLGQLLLDGARLCRGAGVAVGPHAELSFQALDGDAGQARASGDLGSGAVALPEQGHGRVSGFGQGLAVGLHRAS